jgi:hypothetical protein
MKCSFPVISENSSIYIAISKAVQWMVRISYSHGSNNTMFHSTNFGCQYKNCTSIGVYEIQFVL